MFDRSDALAPGAPLEQFPGSFATSRFGRAARGTRHFARRQPIGAVSAVVLVLMILVAIFARQLEPYGPNVGDVGPTLDLPSGSHLFGTDQFGRDLLSRVLEGSRSALQVGVLATLIGISLATIIGGTSGYLAGPTDHIIQRLVDTAQSLPPLVVLISVLAVIGADTWHIILVLSCVQALGLSRVVRGSVITIRNTVYLEAERALGASHLRILLQHVFPNIFPTVIVLVSTSIGANILAQASLAFLGYGVNPPNPTWGGMISAEGRLYMLSNPWLLVFPTLALSIVVFATNMLGDALRDELDPRLRGTR